MHTCYAGLGHGCSMHTATLAGSCRASWLPRTGVASASSNLIRFTAFSHSASFRRKSGSRGATLAACRGSRTRDPELGIQSAGQLLHGAGRAAAAVPRARLPVAACPLPLPPAAHRAQIFQRLLEPPQRKKGVTTPVVALQGGHATRRAAAGSVLAAPSGSSGPMQAAALPCPPAARASRLAAPARPPRQATLLPHLHICGVNAYAFAGVLYGRPILLQLGMRECPVAEVDGAVGPQLNGLAVAVHGGCIVLGCAAHRVQQWCSTGAPVAPGGEGGGRG